jgi:hypothetical protein
LAAASELGLDGSYRFLCRYDLQVSSKTESSCIFFPEAGKILKVYIVVGLTALIMKANGSLPESYLAAPTIFFFVVD